MNDTNTTPSTASQAPAVSIKTPEFRDLLANVEVASDAVTNEGADPAVYSAAFDNLIAHIDAKLAQARYEGQRDSHDTNMTMLQLRMKAEDRATAAEAKLEAIRRGVEGLIGRPDNWIKRDEVLALLQPQPKADESGLPG